jgi:glucokinase
MRIAGIDIGGTRIKTGIFDNGKIIKREVFPTGASQGPERVIGKIVEFLKENRVERAGIGVPGLVEPKRGVVRIPPNLPGWVEVEMGRVIGEETGIPVFIGNDANIYALGEWRFGRGKGKRNLVVLTLGTGVGGGIIVNGKLLLGSTGGAAEVGHITLDPSGPLCNCGNRGCLEAYLGSKYLVDRAKALLKKFGKEEIEESKITPEYLSERAEEGDSVALALWDEYGFYLALGIVNLIHLFDPEIVILGGGVVNAFKFFSGRMRNELKRRLMHFEGRKIRIEVSKLGDDAGVYGAYYYAEREGDV